MSEYTIEFANAFNHAMLYEVGRFWNPKDPDVISGQISTREQRRKVGYVNIPQDSGGETKYGIAQNANPEIDVRHLDLNGAMDVYYHKYWIFGYNDKLDYPISIIHFDGCVNHGVRRACRFLQKAVGAEEDGFIGVQTLKALRELPPENVIKNISDIRATFYLTIVKNRPSQKIFLNGWMNRINEVTKYCLNALL